MSGHTRHDPHRIDVHHHLFPPPFVAKLLEHQHYLSRGIAAHWTPQVSLDDMDEASVATSITSITAPGFSFVKPELLPTITRECNDYGARDGRSSRRFGCPACRRLHRRQFKEIEHARCAEADGIRLHQLWQFVARRSGSRR